MPKKRSIYITALAVFFIGGLATGWLVEAHISNSALPQIVKQVRENAGSVLINPVLYTETTQSRSLVYNPLRKSLDTEIKTILNNQSADSVSVYFRELNTGLWTGINEDVAYEPSSMLKVLVMLSYLRLAETEPSILSTKLTYAVADQLGQHYKPISIPKSGQYSVEDLIVKMITESDNIATDSLVKANRKGFDLVYDSLQLPPPPQEKLIDFMSPKSYSVLFRTLYNSSFLSRGISERALLLLTQTTFTQGLVAGVPHEITVAHKFGEHTDIRPDGSLISRQLHDCGIIYRPGNPYFLCVMTKGKDFSKLEKVISTISETVYKQLENNSR
ncbi:class A beta-lactamase-related serine hydrolase [Candidatus Parcubacteria bacterium]|nr:class A beta-lactamase-related serine hydrolase [Candidatus Parcubacteria bacterium]